MTVRQHVFRGTGGGAFAKGKTHGNGAGGANLLAGDARDEAAPARMRSAEKSDELALLEKRREAVSDGKWLARRREVGDDAAGEDAEAKRLRKEMSTLDREIETLEPSPRTRGAVWLFSRSTR